MIYAVVVLLPLLVNLAVKMNLYSLIGYGYEPRSAAGQPVIGKLCLPAVYDFLLEDTIFVEDRVACCGECAGCKSVKVAGGKSAKTAVTESRIGFFLIDMFNLYIELLERLCHFVLHTEVVEVCL